jgi:hypothetical protein
MHQKLPFLSLSDFRKTGIENLSDLGLSAFGRRAVGKVTAINKMAITKPH